MTLVSGNPTVLIDALRIAGSPTPNATVRKTENDTRRSDRSAECGAILAEWCVYAPGAAPRITDGGCHITPPVPKAPQAGAATHQSRCQSPDL